MTIDKWWESLFATIDARRTPEFVAYLCEDGLFRYGSNPEIAGRAAIATVVDHVFSTFLASEHELRRHWEADNCRIAQGIVTYTRLDHAKVSLPFCNVLTMRGALVERYEIFIDPTPLMR